MSKLLAVVLALSACGKSSDSSKAKESAPPASSPTFTIDAAVVNALVPAELKDKLAFDKTDVVEERGKSKLTFTLAAPKGWKQDGTMFAKLQGGDMGASGTIDLASDCDGSCVAKDWAASADKVVFKQFKDAAVVKTATTPTSRLLIATRDKSTFVAYAWWVTGANRYHYCMVTLDEPLGAAAPAFAQACQAVNIAGDH